MFKIFINPSQFNKFADIIFKPLLLISILSLVIGLVFVFFISPDDYQQGSTVKIMYIHVPAAWLSLMTFFIMTIYSIIALALLTSARAVSRWSTSWSTSSWVVSTRSSNWSNCS